MTDAQDEDGLKARLAALTARLVASLPPVFVREVGRRPRVAAGMVGLFVAGLLVLVIGGDGTDEGTALTVPHAVRLVPDDRVKESPRGAETARGSVLTGVSGETSVGLVPPTVVLPPPVPPAYDAGRALTPAPDAELIEQSGMGYLPVIGRDGRKAWQVYAKPFDLTDKRPRIAIVLSNLGISATTTDAAINRLPPAVSLSFAHFKPRLNEWIRLARAGGHEVLLDLPLEPADFDHNDPGPNTLLSALEPDQNLQRLKTILSRGTGYVGMVGTAGSRFIQERSDLEPVLSVLQRRGLIYVDNRSTPQSVVPVVATMVNRDIAVANRVLDLDPTRAGVDKRLSDLEDAARRNGRALGLVQQPYPVVMERIAIWAQTLSDRGFVLAPVSAVVAIPSPPTKAEEASSKALEARSGEPKSGEPKSGESKAGEAKPGQKPPAETRTPQSATPEKSK